MITKTGSLLVLDGTIVDGSYGGRESLGLFGEDSQDVRTFLFLGKISIVRRLNSDVETPIAFAFACDTLPM